MSLVVTCSSQSQIHPGEMPSLQKRQGSPSQHQLRPCLPRNQIADFVTQELELPVQHSPSSSHQALQCTTTDVQRGNAVVPACKESDDICCYTCGRLHVSGLNMEFIKERFDIMLATTSGLVVIKGSGNEVSDNKIRFSLYQMFNSEKFGCLGKGNRMKLPNSVESKIKELFPDLNGNYTNFRAESVTNL